MLCQFCWKEWSDERGKKSKLWQDSDGLARKSGKLWLRPPEILEVFDPTK